MRFHFSFIAVLLLVMASKTHAEHPPLWGQLEHGPFAVGFKSGWQFDYTRRYNMTFADGTAYAAGKAPRPILVNTWYPAVQDKNGQRMPHGDYFFLPSNDARIRTFHKLLAKYNQATMTREVMGKPSAELNDRERALLSQSLGMTTACYRDAVQAPGSFPLVIYHAGAGSSFDDNSVLCEYLASHGFIVLGSPFSDDSGKSFATDGREGSVRDLEYLIAYARQLPEVDWSRVGVVGHSLGAQAALLFCSRPNAAVEAVVSLDTTQDYHRLDHPSWDNFTPLVAANHRHVKSSLLFAANPYAIFELPDALTQARRYYLTIMDQGHNDFISQGILHKELAYRLRQGDVGQDAATLAKEKATLDRASAHYQSLCRYVLHFLQAELSGDKESQEYLAKKYRDTTLGGPTPHVEFVAAGSSGPDPYKEDGLLPPTPRQLRRYLRDHGSAKTIALLKRFQMTTPDAPIFISNFKVNLVGDLLDVGKKEEALALCDYYRQSGLDCGKFFFSSGEAFQGLGLKKVAVNFYQRVLLLEPEHAEAAKRLKEVSDDTQQKKQP